MSRYLLMLGAGLVAVGSMGCSEAVPPASQGAFISTFQSDPGRCDIADIHNSAIGTVDSRKISDIKKDGVGRARIFCSVIPSGGGFNIEAELKLGPTALRVNVDNFSMAATEANPVSGTVIYQSQETVKPYVTPQDSPCMFWIENNQEVAAGRAWAQFVCPVIADAGTNSECALGESTVALQNCDQ